MTAVAGPILAALAGRLITEYVDKNWLDPAEKTVREPQILRTLERLFANKLFPGELPTLDEVASFPLDKLRKKVKELETRLNLAPVDGVIDAEFLNQLCTTCQGAGTSYFGPQTRTALPGPKDPGGLVPTTWLKPDALLKRQRLYVYQIEGTLPKLRDDGDENAAQKCLDRAFHLWQQSVYVRVRKFDPGTGPGDEDRIKPNLIIRCEQLDGTGNNLALATVGVPGVTSFSLNIDSQEDWTTQKFTAVLCHEIGHLLGLDHSYTKNTLMYPTMMLDASGSPSVQAPTAVDIALAQDLWGPAPN